jgi:hypothetical protein
LGPQDGHVLAKISPVDRYGYIEVCRDMSRLSRCTPGMPGDNRARMRLLVHGACRENSAAWFEREGDVVVADRDEVTRAPAVYGAGSSGGGVIRRLRR